MTDNLELATGAINDGRHEDAIRLLEEIVSDGEFEPEVLVYLGIAYVQAERPKDAVEVLEQAKELVEEHCVVSLFLGRALKALGRIDEAVTEMRHSIRLDPDQVEAWEDLSHMLFFNREYRHALDFTVQGVKKFPESFVLRSIHAMCYHRLGDYSGGMYEWNKVYEHYPESMMALSNLAYLLLIQNKVDEAIPLVEKAEILDPMDCRPRILRSEVLMQTGDLEKASSLLQKVVSEDPCITPALARLAVISQRLDNSEKCTSYISQVKELITDEPRGWWALYYIFSHLEREDDLYSALRFGTESDPASSAPWIGLATYYEKKGEVERAEDAWTKSFQLRGYVKVHCAKCNHDFRYPYREEYGFDLTENRICDNCASELQVHHNLATM